METERALFQRSPGQGAVEVTSGYERITAAFNHDESAGLPLDIGGSTVTGIATDALFRLLSQLGYDTKSAPISPADSIQGISAPDAGTVKTLGIDTLRIGSDRLSLGENGLQRSGPDGLPELEGTDAFGVSWKRRSGEHYFNQASTPLGAAGKIRDALSGYRFPVPDPPSIAAIVAPGRDTAARHLLYPVLDRDCAGLFEMSARLRGMQRYYLDFHDDMAGVEEIAERLLEYKIRYWDAALDAWGDGPVAIAEADDYGTQSSLLVNPATIKKVFLSRYRLLIDFIKKKNPQARIIFHSCGAIRKIIPDLIDAGIDALNPVQYTSTGMDPAALKADFGADLVFWGGAVDTQHILPRATPAEVRAETRRIIDIMAPCGGYVCAAVHNIQADVPTDNIIAILQAVEAYRREQGL